MNELTLKANKLRRDIVELVYKSGAGHIGGDLSCIDILTVLYNRIMNVSKDRLNDPNRDRFVLSKAHCADGLFCALADLGYIDRQELMTTFSRFGSKFLGHPNRDIPGIEICGGSLGHGLSVGVGMALGARLDKRKFRVYVLLGDGEMAEGSNYEAMMAAGHYKLDNLCATVDLNGLQISGTTKEVMDSSDMGEKFRAFGWRVIDVPDGNDCDQLVKAYEQVKESSGQPVAVIAHTVKGKGISFMENVAKWHHGAISEDLYSQAVNELEEAIK